MDTKTYLIFDSDVMKLRTEVNDLKAMAVFDGEKEFKEKITLAFEQLVTTLEHFLR